MEGLEGTEVVVRSSAGMLEEFINGIVWGDLKNELEAWLDGARDGLEDTNADEKELYRNQGRADAVRRMILLPEVMRDALLEKQREETRDDSNKDELEEMINE